MTHALSRRDFLGLTVAGLALDNANHSLQKNSLQIKGKKMESLWDIYKLMLWEEYRKNPASKVTPQQEP